MYYDLNVLWPSQFEASGSSQKLPSKKEKKDAQAKSRATASTQPDALKGLSSSQTEKMRALTEDLGELGYRTIAYNHIVEGKFDPLRHRNPFASSEQPSLSQPPFPDLDTSKNSLKQASTKVVQLSRMTLVLNEASIGKSGHGMTAPSTSALLGYDLLSAQPFNDASFVLLCLTLCELKPGSVDIISLDLATSARLPFFLKRSTVNAALANGVVFEICYSRVVKREEGEENHSKIRRNIISAARDILRVTNGKGVIFSSGAADILGLRGPYDVINLAAIFGMNQAAAKDAISSTCRSLLVRAETRKTFRGAVSLPVICPSSVSTPTLENIGKRKQTEEAIVATPSKRTKSTAS
ncbi:hypothetical protein CBS101457_001478 [Exobasidium rhododendri]|nr:hypothetical protein CBS101457_001478 [Exobasidium rhododendri]